MENPAGKPQIEDVDIPGFDFDLAAILQAVDVEESPFDEYLKDCPLCKSTVRYFFVNFNEKLKMCENNECDYPFGYAELEFVKQDNNFASDEELESISLSRPEYSGSVISAADWSDIDKLNKAYDLDDQCDVPIQRCEAASNAKLQEVLRQKEAELQTKKNLQDIKKLNVQLQKTYDEDNVSCIKNEKWIKHLQTLQSLSGVKLLKNEEMAVLSRAELGPQELTIGIENGNASITINLPQPTTAITEVINLPKPTTVITEVINLPKPTTGITEVINLPKPTTEITEVINLPKPTTVITEAINLPKPTTGITEVINLPKPTTEITEVINLPKPTTGITEVINLPEPTTAITEVINLPKPTTSITEVTKEDNSNSMAETEGLSKDDTEVEGMVF